MHFQYNMVSVYIGPCKQPLQSWNKLRHKSIGPGTLCKLQVFLFFGVTFFPTVSVLKTNTKFAKRDT